MKKWGIERRPPQPLDHYRPATNRICSKNERLREEPLNPWPLIPSPTHIFQLVATLPQLPHPFSELGSLLPISASIIKQVSESTHLQ
jgi:hypothetical protein